MASNRTRTPVQALSSPFARRSSVPTRIMIAVIAVLSLTVAMTSTIRPVSAQSFVTINVGDDVQSLVDSYSEGTTFTFAPGTHYGVQVHPKDGQTFTATEGTVVLDGNGAVKPAFSSWKRSRDITISNLEITNYATPDYTGVIDARSQTWFTDDWMEHTNWRIDNVHLHHNNGGGRSTAINVGSGTTVTNSVISRNEGTAIYGNGRDILIENNLITGNSLGNAGSTSDLLWHSGGIKLVVVQNVVVRHNTVNKNKGPGIWFDVNADNVTIEDNLVKFNTLAGIQYEISRNATIRHNKVVRNGLRDPRGWLHAAGIVVSSSYNVVVDGNTLFRNKAGIGVFDQRTLRATEGGQDAVPVWGRLFEADGSPMLWRTSNVTVTNNTIRSSGINGASATNIQSVNSDIYATTNFANNGYYGSSQLFWGVGDELAIRVNPQRWARAGNS
jgi:parallel beta-helix repeat protein